MAKKNYYAVIHGRNIESPKIFFNWEDCSNVVTGFRGAKYKGFATKEEANKYILENFNKDDYNTSSDDNDNTPNYLNVDIDSLINQRKSTYYAKLEDNVDQKDTLICYVDGSFKDQYNNYSFGLVALRDNEILFKDYGIGSDPEAIKLRNVAGEIMSSMKAISFAIKNDYKNIIIYYDYLGIEKWYEKSWKAKNMFTQKYVDFTEEAKKRINIKFVKIKAHSGDTMNNLADSLAAKAFVEMNSTHVSF